MNAEADRWLRENRLGKNHGYILASASESEFTGVEKMPMSPNWSPYRKPAYDRRAASANRADKECIATMRY
jgi:hypothetical protein